MGSIDVRFSGDIYHKNYPQIIASDRALAKLIGARFAWQSSTLAAGTVVARVTATGFYVPYNDGGSGGAEIAVGVTLDDINYDASATGSGASGEGTQAGRVCVGGASLYYSKLTGIDAAALVDMKARVVVDISGTSLLEF